MANLSKTLSSVIKMFLRILNNAKLMILEVEFLKYVFNLRNIEKLRLAGAVDTGSMASIFSS